MRSLIATTSEAKAIGEGKRTLIHRVCKVQPRHDNVYVEKSIYDSEHWSYLANGGSSLHDILEKPPYKVGEIIYVRETFCIGKYDGLYNGEGCNDSLVISQYPEDNNIIYFAEAVDIVDSQYLEGEDGAVWKPSVHMSKECARLFVRVKSIRLKRLNEITPEEAEMAGVTCWSDDSALIAFKSYWESVAKRGAFDGRWAWAVEVENISKAEAMS